MLNYKSFFFFFPPLLMKTIEEMTLLIFLVLALVTHVSACDACPKCGSMEVPYPLSTSYDCGDPRYKIYCNNDVLQFQSSKGSYYQILSVNPSAHKLVISPPTIQEDSCFSSDLALGGLWLDENLPFNISTHNTVLLFNCSAEILHSPLNCSASSICRNFEEEDEGSSCRGTLCCNYLKDSSMNSHRIRLRVGGCTAYTSVVDMKPGAPIDGWNYGIELQWVPLDAL